MKKVIHIICLLICFAVVHAQKNTGKRSVSFDAGWHFIKYSTIEAQEINYDDSKWRTVDLPHDWSIEDLPNQKADSIVGPFSRSSIGQGATGFTEGGTGWYRKKFTSAKADEKKIFVINFDGVYMNSDVWLNGQHLGNHPYGYTPFYYDLTPYLNPAGKENVLAVRVRNEGKNSRWYSGSGIYRHVWLTVTEPVHVAEWGVYITTPVVSKNRAVVQIKSTINNEQNQAGNISLVTTILSPSGKTVALTQKAFVLETNAPKTDSQNIIVSNPLLWSLETPELYKVVTEIKSGNKTIDRVETPFGICSLSFTAQNGFLLNGKKVLLKGGCIHHDNGPLGAAAIDRAEERKIEILKKNGFNAIRTSHNPPSRQLLDACDRLGMLVIDEAFDMWAKQKNINDYHLYFKDWWNKDLTSMILRDRNHPSVILWSIGNEIPERADSTGLATRKMLKERVHQLDPTRMITEAINTTSNWEKKTPSVFQDLDIAGYNYEFGKYEPDHQNFPQRIMMGTETFAGKALENWNMAEKHPYVIGDFVWTAFDYLGEASIGHTTLDSTKKFSFLLDWPWYNAWCGDIDLIGNKKPQSYYRDVVWRNSPIEIEVHAPIPKGLVESVSNWGWADELKSWTWPGHEGTKLQVHVYTRSNKVKLELNGKLVAEQIVTPGSITATFNISYQPGILVAKGFDSGKQVCADTLKTTRKPYAVRLTADRKTINANVNDLAFVNADIVDEKGNIVPWVNDMEITYNIAGDASLAAAGNADPTDISGFKQNHKKVYRGRSLAIIKPAGKKGTVTLSASAKGLKDGFVQIVIK